MKVGERVYIKWPVVRWTGIAKIDTQWDNGDFSVIMEKSKEQGTFCEESLKSVHRRSWLTTPADIACQGKY